MSDWASYQIQDFIPFTADVYFRLLAQLGESFWPLQLLTLSTGVTALVMALTGHYRVALALLAPLWVLVGLAFFGERYTRLNWAGGYFCWAWLLQGALLALLAASGRGLARPRSLLDPATQSGLLISLCGLVGFPLLAPVIGHSWRQAEVFGLHPDPTAAVTVGVLLLAVRGPLLWVVAVIPVLWLVVSGVTLKVLDSPWFPLLFVLAVAAFAGLISGFRASSSR
ncbi:DUF6064 family protein [Microbulbifer bruguierae]|uniref:DUF6064 family protein n=1 Tax=Microbulbifer bruguierae TaxID=3029061 RepID=A0ABY8NGE2_9GAMM|nr:DUF6064 family protein [Microbulbifer bruguierae]WGL17993.1 DUF6064 family protein [Microbulbifer bruguierae]